MKLRLVEDKELPVKNNITALSHRVKEKLSDILENDTDEKVMGIVFYSPETTKEIPEGIDFLNQEYSNPSDVAAHLKKGDVVGFCTGSGGDFILKFREGYSDESILNEYFICVRLGMS